MKILLFLIASSLMLFFVSCSGSSQTVKPSNQTSPTETVQPKSSDSPSGSGQQKPIEIDKVTSVAAEARYKSFFEQDSKCAKSYDELFGNKDGFYSEDSPCTERISIDRDGAATKSVELKRYNKNTGQMQTIEKSVWNAKISSDDFKKFAEDVVNDDFVKSYPEGMQIYTSNFRITVSQGDLTKNFSGNADNKNPRPISVIDRFKKLNDEAKWTKVE